MQINRAIIQDRKLRIRDDMTKAPKEYFNEDGSPRVTWTTKATLHPDIIEAKEKAKHKLKERKHHERTPEADPGRNADSDREA